MVNGLREWRLFATLSVLSVWSCAASPITPPGDGAIADGAFDDASVSDAARDASDESRDAEVVSDAASAPDASPDASDGSPDAGLPSARAWEDEILYFVIPDRFVNGDPSNDLGDVPRFVNRPGLAVSGPEIATRHRLALTALFTLPGIPQLYYGAEVGMYGGPDPDNRRDMPSWAFDPDTRVGARAGFAGDPAETFDWTRRLTQLRQSTAALRRGRYLELWRQNGAPRPNVLSFLRGTDDDVAIVVLHAGATRQTMSLPILTNPGLRTSERSHLAEGTVLEDALGSGVEVRVEDGRIALALPPLSALVLRPRR